MLAVLFQASDLRKYMFPLYNVFFIIFLGSEEMPARPAPGTVVTMPNGLPSYPVNRPGGPPMPNGLPQHPRR
jgi:hypothetical protein